MSIVHLEGSLFVIVEIMPNSFPHYRYTLVKMLNSIFCQLRNFDFSLIFNFILMQLGWVYHYFHIATKGFSFMAYKFF